MASKDTAPHVPGGPAIAAAAKEALEWARLEEQAGREGKVHRAIVEDAARAAFLARPDVTTWQAGPALIVFRESYRPLPAGKETALPSLVVERSLAIGASPDWAGAEAAAGAAWPAVAAALGLHVTCKPARGALVRLTQVGDTEGAALALSLLSRPQFRRAVE